MLLWTVVVASIILWPTIVIVYFWKEIHEYLDNRFGPKSKEIVRKPPRRRLYD